VNATAGCTKTGSDDLLAEGAAPFTVYDADEAGVTISVDDGVGTVGLPSTTSLLSYGSQVHRTLALDPADYWACVDLEAADFASEAALGADTGMPEYTPLGAESKTIVSFAPGQGATACIVFTLAPGRRRNARLTLDLGFARGTVRVTRWAVGQCAGTATPLPERRAAGPLVWSDEFDYSGKPDPSKWGYDLGTGAQFGLVGWGNNEDQYYTDREANANVSGGVLKITARCEAFSGKDFTSARLVTKGKAAWRPGHRIEARARLPTGVGSWPAIWMLPTTSPYGDWPASGEIDILEHVGCELAKVVGSVHTEAYNWVEFTQKNAHDYVEDPAEWHVYSIDWDAAGIQWYVDGRLFFSFDNDGLGDYRTWPFDQPFHLLLNVAVGGFYGGFCLAESPSCSDPSQFAADQVMTVDWVRVYELEGAGGGAGGGSGGGGGSSGSGGGSEGCLDIDALISGIIDGISSDVARPIAKAAAVAGAKQTALAVAQAVADTVAALDNSP